MNKLFFLITLLALTSTSVAQTGYYPDDKYIRNRGLKTDSSLHLPVFSSLRFPDKAYQGAGSIRYLTNDSSIYVWTGTGWYRGAKLADTTLYLATKTDLLSAGGLFGRSDTRNNAGSALSFNNAGQDFLTDSISNESRSYVESGGRYGSLNITGSDFVYETSTGSAASGIQVSSVAGTGLYHSRTSDNHTIGFQLTDDMNFKMSYGGPYSLKASSLTPSMRLLARDTISDIIYDYTGALGGGGGVSDSALSKKVDKQDYFGRIYTDSLWGSSKFSEDFVVNGATATDSSGVIVLSGGTSTLTSTVDINVNQTYGIKPYYSNLEDWVFEVKAQVITHGILPIGVRSYAANNLSVVLYGYINTSTGSSLIHCGNTATSTTNIPVNIGDHFSLRVERHGWKMSVTFRNLTTNSSTVTTTGAIGHLGTAPPVTSRYALFAYSGKFYIDSIGISSATTRNASVLVLGDSKSQLFPALGGSQKRWPTMLAEHHTLVNHAGRAETTADWLLSVDEVLALNPKQVVIGAVSNDQRFSVNSDSTKARYYRLERALRNAGIAVYHIDGMYESVQNNKPWAEYINSSRSADSVFKTLALTSISGTLESDNVHPNELGNTIVYNVIQSSGKLKNVKNLYESPGRFIQNLLPAEPAQIASYNITGDSKQTGSHTLNGYLTAGTATDAGSLAQIPLTLKTRSNQNIYMYGNGTFGTFIGFGNNNGMSAPNMIAGAMYGQSLNFKTGTSSYLNTLSLSSTGMVGVGTTAPSHSLTVSGGQIRVTGINSASTVDSILVINDGVIEAAAGVQPRSGVYTTTLTNVSNISSATANEFHYIRAGNVVSFSLILTVTPSTGSTSTQIDFSLPAASNFTASTNLIATGSAIGASGVIAVSNADVTNDRGHIEFTSTNTSAHTVTITGSYQIL